MVETGNTECNIKDHDNAGTKVHISSKNDAIEAADKKKLLGNDAFKNKNYQLAINLYTEAVELCTEWAITENLHLIHSNRALCHIKLENFGSALIDAEESYKLDDTYAKAYYRHGQAQVALGHYKLAVKDFQQVVKLSPKDKDAAQRVKECKKAIKEQAFADAIASAQTEPVSATIDLSIMKVDSTYKGPHYGGMNFLQGKDDVDAVPNALKGDQYPEALMEFVKTPGNVLHKRYAYMMVLDFIKLMKEAHTLEYITVNPQQEFTVCGDVHGQFYDLMNIFKINGKPSEKNPYLFNGDFVDRGSYSVECIFTLMAYKVLYPKHMWMARGNHETINMNRLYGFEGEVTKKYDAKLYQLFCEAFCLLPLCHVINNEIFVVHGGLFSTDGVKISDIEAVNRVREPPDEGLMNEMLWSDPHPLLGRRPSQRGMGVAFGADVTKAFLKDNNLKLVIRSHEMKANGYSIEHDGQLVTVFSAPNYIDTMGNKGAYIRFKCNESKELIPNYCTFECVPHPPSQPLQYANPLLCM